MTKKFTSTCFCLLMYAVMSTVTSQQYAGIDRRRCLPDLAVAWTTELGVSPVTSSFIADLDADGDLDIIATTFSGDLHVVRGSDGKYMRGRGDKPRGVPGTSGWPYRLDHGTFHTSPLLYDIDQDGLLDVLVVSSSGQILFLNPDGHLVNDKQHQLDEVMVDRHWYTKQVTADQELIHGFILDNPSQAQRGVEYVRVDPHVLSNPVIEDLNLDGITEELILAVSYYYDLQDYKVAQSVAEVNLTELSDNYLVSAMVFFNLTSMSPYHVVHLDLTKKNSEYPAYLFGTPTVVDLDPDTSGLEVIIGTASGKLHVIPQTSGEEKNKHAFNVHMDPIHSQVSVSDVNGDGILEMIVAESGGVVSCYSNKGSLLWEAELSSLQSKSNPSKSHSHLTLSSGTRLVDFNGDGSLKILVSSDNGHVWLLDSASGKLIADWPVDMGPTVSGPPLVTKMHGFESNVLVNLDSGGTLSLLTTNRKCKNRVKLGESSLVRILSHDLLPANLGLEFLVATRDGALMCLFQTNSTDGNSISEFSSGIPRSDFTPSEEEWLSLRSMAQAGEMLNHNDFTSIMHGILGLNSRIKRVKCLNLNGPCQDSRSDAYLSGILLISPWSQSSGLVVEISTQTFEVKIQILDQSNQSAPYHCQILLGSILLDSHILHTSGLHTLLVPSPTYPCHGHLVIKCRNKHGVLYTDMTAIKFFHTFQSDLQWLLIGPTLFLAVFLLFIFGFPASDILPVTVPSKQR